MSKSAQSSSSRPVSVEALLENVNDFIQSIYSDVGLMSPPTPVTSSRVRNNHRNFTPQPSPSLNSNSSSLNSSSAESELNLNIPVDTSSRRLAFSPQNRHNIDLEIERINRICDSVDLNLRSIGVYVTGRREDEHTTSIGTDSSVRPICRNNVLSAIVDLSETQTETPEVLTPLGRIGQTNQFNDGDDDEVVVVSSNIPPIIDLCTPGEETTSRRPRVQRNQLQRRVLDETCQPEVVPVRRRRVSSATSGTNINNKDIASTPESTPSGNANAKSTSSDRDPCICPVCMDSFQRRRPTTTKCGHIFCEECIKQAIRLTHKCPLCNTKIWDKNLLRIYL